MDRDEALGLLKGGPEGVAEWNRRRKVGEEIPDLRVADLEEANLTRANLEGVNLTRADLHGANFSVADLHGANLSGAFLEGADLFGAILRRADLRGADIRGANLHGANFNRADLTRADLEEAVCRATIFADVDLSDVKGLDKIRHEGPSTVGIDTLFRSQGKIPQVFLRGCGLTPWEILSVNFYDPALTPARFAELQHRIFDAWTKGRSMINGCFISYSWKDAEFVDKLQGRLTIEGVNVWRDKRDMIAGPIQVQVWEAIQRHHVVLLVLSDTSVRSDWVENELDMARRKEKAEGRAVLCPVALDDTWKTKVEAKDGPGDPNRQLWRTLEPKSMVDFSDWRTETFEEAFQKLLRGLKIYYGPTDPPAT